MPWHDERVLADASLDAVVSQAVLEHVDDVPFTNRSVYRWLKPDGWASHSIDCRSHGWADTWSGHWSSTPSSGSSSAARARGSSTATRARSTSARPTDAGFEVTSQVPRLVPPGEAMERDRITSKLRPLFTDQDLRCNVLFLQVRKPPPSAA